MVDVALKGITKRFKLVTALDDLSFDIKDGEFFVLLGPTGAGKTTTLRVIAGLEKPEAGDLYFAGESVTKFTPAERDVAFVFQQYSLYPTLTVYDNLASPLRSPMHLTSEADIQKKVEEIAAVLRISHLLTRKSSQLSGGEMQRVAIGRAIVRQPKIYLMDEPLSNLDAKLREALRIELAYLQKTQNSTTLFVTHDQIEALTMADRIAVLNAGRILQIGTPRDIYDRPATTFVAQLVGTPRINLMEASPEEGKIHILNSGLKFAAPAAEGLSPSCTIGLRPEDIRLDNSGNFTGEIVLQEPLGVETILHIKSGELTLTCLVAGTSDRSIGENVRFQVKADRLSYFDKAGYRINF